METKDILMLLWPVVTAIAVGWAGRLVNKVQRDADSKVERLTSKLDTLSTETHKATAEMARFEATVLVRLNHLEQRKR
ncbi:MAG: hypothetical protein V3R83_09920 [Gammaproteobacteria bacterium]